MNRVLSQEEIDVLLASTGAAGADPRAHTAGYDVVAYDFRRPDRVSRDQIRSLQFLHDRFARNLSTSLSAYLRSVTDVTVVSVEQCAYSEFLMSLPDVTAYYAISLASDVTGALEVHPGIAFTMIDRLLGGTGDVTIPKRALTEIEQNVIDAGVKLILENLTETWTSILEHAEFTIQGHETRPQMLQVMGPNEIVIVLAFDVKIGETRGMINLCVPASIVELAGSNLSKTGRRSHRPPTGDEERRLAAALGRVPLPVSVRVESSIPADELARLKPGDVLALGHSARSPVQVLIGSTPKFKGRLAERDGFGVVSILEPIETATPREVSAQ